MSNIDWDFILEREGYELQGYVPDAEGSKSGVTIASGFDLGQRNINDLKGLPESLIEKLKPFLSLKGAEASAIAPQLNVSDAEAKIINEFAKSTELVKLKTSWKNTTGTSFDNLESGKATALASVAFQHGYLPSETPNFWKQTTSGDWEGAYNNLLDWESTGEASRYQSRRELEAGLLKPFLSEDFIAKKNIENVEAFTTFDEDQFRKNAEEIGNLAFTEENQQQIKESLDFDINNIIDGLKTYSDSAIQGAKDFEKLNQDFADRENQKKVNEAAVKKGKNEFVYANKDEIVKSLEKQNKELEETDFLEGHKNPSFLDPMLDIPSMSSQEQFQIDKINLEAKEKLSKEFSYLDIGKAAIDQEWITSWILKHNGREDLDPNYEFGINDFVLNEEQQKELKDGVNPDYWDAFDDATSYPELLRIKEKILDVQEKEKILMSKGIATGMTARFLAAVLDPTAWAVAIATDGLMAPAIVMNKANRIKRIIRGGFAAGTTNLAIEGALVSQNPTLGTKELLIATAAGFVLGGTIRGIKSGKKLDEDTASINKAMDDYVNVKEKEIIDGADLNTTTKGNKKYDVANKTEQDDYDKVADEYSKDLSDRTTIRTDGNTEIKMPDGKDEYIITKDGKIYKCD